MEFDKNILRIALQGFYLTECFWIRRILKLCVFSGFFKIKFHSIAYLYHQVFIISLTQFFFLKLIWSILKRFLICSLQCFISSVSLQFFKQFVTLFFLIRWLSIKGTNAIEMLFSPSRNMSRIRKFAWTIVFPLFDFISKFNKLLKYSGLRILCYKFIQFIFYTIQLQLEVLICR